MRALAAVLVLAVVGCQCLQPVEEGLDGGGGGTAGGGAAGGSAGGTAGGGTAGGTAGGGTAGGVAGGTAGGTAGGAQLADAGPCSQPAQCTGTPATPSWCGSIPAAFSCIESRCTWECPQVPAARTCTVNMGTYCLECGDAGTNCPITGTTACGIPQITGSATVENGATCTSWPQSGDPFVGVEFQRGASAQCRYGVWKPDGGELLGELWKLNGGDYLADFPGFGGWCTGRSANTGAARGIITCPLCSFTLFGFE